MSTLSSSDDENSEEILIETGSPRKRIESDEDVNGLADVELILNNMEVVCSSDTDAMSRRMLHRKKIAPWAVANHITHKSLDQLLTILRNVKDIKTLHDLPKSSRKLLKTEKTVDTVVKAGMEYFNFGVEQSIV